MIEVEIDDEAWTVVDDLEDRVHQAATIALEKAGAVTVSLTDDDAVADLNQRFRGKTGPTNVLSFPAPETAQPFLGDVILAFGVCEREAVAQGKSLSDHLQHLVVHGVLHLQGFDHLDDIEAREMEDRERMILARLGVSDPYASRDEPD
ncbi:MAG: rRNA maturation RNase YbeY [Caulobacterales bacterium]|nr:rRNA maturation RNase YbeY [Caulobacterales bacterium]